MDFLNALKERIPDYAKDIRLNLDATIARRSLDPADALGAALAAAFAAQVEDHRRCDSRLGAALRHGCERRAYRRGAHGHEQRLVSVCRDGGRRRSEDAASPSCG